MKRNFLNFLAVFILVMAIIFTGCARDIKNADSNNKNLNNYIQTTSPIKTHDTTNTYQESIEPTLTPTPSQNTTLIPTLTPTPKKTVHPTKKPTQKPTEKPKPTERPFVKPNPPSDTNPAKYKVVLNPPAKYKNLYLYILNKLRNFETVIDIPLNYFDEINVKTAKDANNTLNKVILEYILDYNPDIYFINGYSFKYTDHKGLLIGDSIKLNISIPKGYKNYSKNSLKERYNNLLNKANKIIDQVNKSKLSDFEKELWVHDYLVRNIAYDQSIKSTSHNASSALLDGTAVCDGYSKAFQLLMLKLGIETHIITGKVNGTGHAWNIVKLNNNYYHVDVTHDDPVVNGKDQGQNAPITYVNFNQTDDIMKRTHSWSKSPVNAKCNSLDMNYYKVKGLIASDIKSYEEILQKEIEKQKSINKEQRKLEVMFTSKVPSEEELRNLVIKILNPSHIGFDNTNLKDRNIFGIYKWEISDYNYSDWVYID